jgi:hypothetical protein
VGAWGADVFDDDVALDVRAAFEEAIEAGASPELAADQVLEAMQEFREDTDDGPVLTLALASLLLDRGVCQHPVFRAAREVIERGDGLDRWREAGGEALAARQAVYQALAGRLP